MSCPRKITLRGDLAYETLNNYSQDLGEDFHFTGMQSFQYDFIPLLNVLCSVQLFLVFFNLYQLFQ